MKKSISIQLPSSSKFIDFALTLLAKGSNSCTPLYLSYSTAQPPKAPQSDNCVGLDLIQKLPKSGNVPILLNTSFNENEPVVMKPDESLDCLLRTDMDAVFINNFLVKKLI